MAARSPSYPPTERGSPDVPSGLRRQHFRECLASALFVFVASALLLLSGALEPLENRLIEARARMLDRAPTGEVAIVEIDAKSLRAISTWPWSRRYHAELIRRLGAAGASMTAFDVDFSARSDPSSDEALASALKDVQPIILPIFQQRASDSSDDHTMLRNRPAAPFRAAAWVGAVNIFPGRDGVVREFPAAEMIHGQIQPSLAVLLSENGSLGDRSFMPDWSIDASRIPRFSFVDVLKGRVPPSALKGKRVIVGATAIELGDRYTIPRFGTVPGVTIQALAAESLIQHRAIVRSGAGTGLIGLLLITLLLFTARFERFGRTFSIAAATLIGTILVAPLAVQSRWPLSIDTAPLIMAAIGGGLVRVILEARHRIRLAAIRDVETGLANERALQSALDEAPPGTGLTAAGIDRFEAIRSALTAKGVAELVTTAAARIEQLIGAPVYRVAPDTLAWMTPAECDPERLCAEAAEQFKRPVLTSGGAIDIQWTFGFDFAASDVPPARLVERALSAVTDARTQGRPCQRFQGLAASALRSLSMMGELRGGIEQDQLFVAYQPKLHLRTGRIVTAEALVRWHHPTEGAIPCDRFIPLAEETGVVREVTRFVLNRVIADSLAAAGDASKIGISVNVSAADISRPEFADEVLRALGQSGVDAARLTLEITESAIIRSRDAALKVLEALRNCGVRLSIDDYGTGQSSLSYLKTLPVNELKIDKMFVTRMCENESDRIMVRSTIDLAHQLGLEVVAEGVEDRETIKLLSELGCDYAQGFMVGRAMPIVELHALAAGAYQRAA